MYIHKTQISAENIKNKNTTGKRQTDIQWDNDTTT